MKIISNKKSMALAEKFCKENLAECCREIIDWHKTGILCDGKTRELAHILEFLRHESLTVAESMIFIASIEMVANREV
jgi:hypothetical protein